MTQQLRFWIVTLSALLAAALTFALGNWQLHRAAQKEQWTAQQQKAEIKIVKGHWLADQTIYIDNRQMDGRQGFFVVTPLVLNQALNPENYLLVERGWIPRNFEQRTQLEKYETSPGVVVLTVRQMAEPTKPAVFAANWGLEFPIVQYVDTAQMQQRIAGKLHGQYLGIFQQLDEPAAKPDGLRRHWYEPASGVEKNYGYALQWFAMSAAIVGLYIWYQWIKPRMKKQDE